MTMSLDNEFGIVESELGVKFGDALKAIEQLSLDDVEDIYKKVPSDMRYRIEDSTYQRIMSYKKELELGRLDSRFAIQIKLVALYALFLMNKNKFDNQQIDQILRVAAKKVLGGDFENYHKLTTLGQLELLVQQESEAVKGGIAATLRE